MKNVARSLFAFYGLLCFSAFVIVMTPISLLAALIFGRRIMKLYLWICDHFWAPLFLNLYLIRRKVYGREKWKDLDGVIIVSNHQSQLDILANPAAMPINKVFTFLAKKEVGNIPLMGLMVRKFGVLVDRKNKESRANSLTDMLAVINHGISILIYAEGTRNRTKEWLAPFYNGAFRMAVETKKPIMVQTLVGTGKLSDPNRLFDLSPGKIHCYWDGPFWPEAEGAEEIERLKETCRNTMIQHFEQHGSR